MSEPLLPEVYRLRTFHPGDDQQWLDLQASDGESINAEQWYRYRDTVLPNGLFLVEQVATGKLVATAGAAHNPNAGRFYFPFGGELGYLIVRADHRKQGLGQSVCAGVVRRLLAAGYQNIRVCVQEHREAALRIYLKLGFEPFLHSPEIERRWMQVCGQLNITFTPEVWPKQCPGVH